MTGASGALFGVGAGMGFGFDLGNMLEVERLGEGLGLLLWVVEAWSFASLFIRICEITTFVSVPERETTKGQKSHTFSIIRGGVRGLVLAHAASESVERQWRVVDEGQTQRPSREWRSSVEICHGAPEDPIADWFPSARFLESATSKLVE